MPEVAPTRRRRDPEARRREILHAAAELIVENGAATLTHRAVAARAGVPLGSTTQYFTSIDDLRESALQQLADEIDRELEEVHEYIADIKTAPERAVASLSEFLADPRAVHAEIALIMAGTTDPRMRELALRWSDSFADMLAEHLGRTRAVAIAVYLDGATIHAGLHDHPLQAAEITAALRALAMMPVADA
ncbi:TetR family transcriptional regulator [Leucobacter insecticola]|uniref:TetR family transcriptional regulator n=1 Tax=Leucobacter insecticola TaxID=2714934 RepID=A0A6G8FI16_9MICO|nr:TetR family transcriptional regulator [Leucobacter insecticola]QIM16007.1 TetR family transcriptional regulator [Leucobacter insecticola]